MTMNMTTPAHPFSPCLEALEPRLAPAGIVALTLKGGALTITGDAADNHVDIRDAGDGTLRIFDDYDSTTLFSLNGGQATSGHFLAVTGGITVNLQGGHDRLTLSAVTIKGPVTVKDTGGNDTFEFASVIFNAAVTLDTGAGNDSIYAEGSTFNSTLTLKTGAGNDTVNLGSGAYRGITADLGTTEGAGRDHFSLADSAPGGSIHMVGDLTLTGKGGTGGINEVFLGAASFHLVGKVKITHGEGHSSLTLNRFESLSEHLLITGGLSYQAGTSTGEVYLADNVTILGKLDLKMGREVNVVDSRNAVMLSLGAFTYTAGTENNRVHLGGESVKISGDAVFTMSAGFDNHVTFGSQVQTLIGGKLTYTGAKLKTVTSDQLDIAGADFRVLGQLSFTAGKNLGNLDISATASTFGGITYKGGLENIVYLGNFISPGRALNILGNLSINLGASEKNELLIYNATVHGATSLLTATVETGTETLYIADSVFHGAATFKSTGGVNGEVRLHNSTFRSAFTLDTGKGDDKVYFDNLPGSASGSRDLRNSFHGAVKILLGAGDDQFLAGKEDNSGVYGNTFHSSFSLDGGGGADTSDRRPVAGNAYLGAVIVKGIETEA